MPTTTPICAKNFGAPTDCPLVINKDKKETPKKMTRSQTVRFLIDLSKEEEQGKQEDKGEDGSRYHDENKAGKRKAAAGEQLLFFGSR